MHTHVGSIKQWVSFSRLSLTALIKQVKYKQKWRERWLKHKQPPVVGWGHRRFWADLSEEKSASSPAVWAVKVKPEQSHTYNCAEETVISAFDPPPRSSEPLSITPLASFSGAEWTFTSRMDSLFRREQVFKHLSWPLCMFYTSQHLDNPTKPPEIPAPSFSSILGVPSAVGRWKWPANSWPAVFLTQGRVHTTPVCSVVSDTAYSSSLPWSFHQGCCGNVRCYQTGESGLPSLGLESAFRNPAGTFTKCTGWRRMKKITAEL